MGGRIVEQVRRALTAAAKFAPVAVAIDATGCSDSLCVALCDVDVPCGYPDSSTGGSSGVGGANTGGLSRDASVDGASGSDASTDASKDGG